MTLPPPLPDDVRPPPVPSPVISGEITGEIREEVTDEITEEITDESPTETTSSDKTIPDFAMNKVRAPDLPSPSEQLFAEPPPTREPVLPPGFAEHPPPPAAPPTEEAEDDDLEERDTLHVDAPPWKGPAEQMGEPEPTTNGSGLIFDLDDLTGQVTSPAAPSPSPTETTSKWIDNPTSERVAALDQAITSAIDPGTAAPRRSRPIRRRSGMHRMRGPATLDDSGIMVVIPEAPVEEVLGGEKISSLSIGAGSVSELAPITPKRHRSPKGYGIAAKTPSLSQRRGVRIVLVGSIALALIAGMGLLFLKYYS